MTMFSKFDVDPIELFNMYMKVVGVPHIEDEPGGEPLLKGKKLGIVNGASWILLWTCYFGKTVLPGVKIINVGNEAVQLNFMRAHKQEHRSSGTGPALYDSIQVLLSGSY